MLLDIVYRCRDPDVILEGLRAVSKDTFPGEQSAAYKERMCEETFLCVSQGHFSLEQIREEPAKSVFSRIDSESSINDSTVHEVLNWFFDITTRKSILQ